MAGKVTASGGEVVTSSSNHQAVGMAVSVCLTPAAPSPLPVPYPTMAPPGSPQRKVLDAPMRTKINGKPILTLGGVISGCIGNQPGTLKEIVSFNTGGPCFPLAGTPRVITELGPTCITGVPIQMNKLGMGLGLSVPAPSGGAGPNAAGSGAGAAGTAPGAPAVAGPPAGTGGDSGAGASSSSTSGAGRASAGGAGSTGKWKPSTEERRLASAPGNSPAQRAAREKVVRDFYDGKPGLGEERADQDLGYGGDPPRANGNAKGYGIDLSKPVKVQNVPPPKQVHQYVKRHGSPGNFVDPEGGQTRDEVGLNSDPSLRQSKTFAIRETNPKQQALVSGAGPVVDDWTDPNNPVPARGGGTQMTLDDTTRSQLQPQPQPW